MNRYLAIPLAALVLAGCGGQSGDEGGSDTSESTGDPLYDQWFAEAERVGDEFAIEYGQIAFDADKAKCEALGGDDGLYEVDEGTAVQILFDEHGVGQEDRSEEAAKMSEIAQKRIIGILCPELTPLIAKAKDPNYHRTEFKDGNYRIGDGRERGTIFPGTYAKKFPVTDCYWERTDAQGNIIDNNFVTHAVALTVAIDPSDASFSSKGCGDTNEWIFQP